MILIQFANPSVFLTGPLIDLPYPKLSLSCSCLLYRQDPKKVKSVFQIFNILSLSAAFLYPSSAAIL